MAELTYREAGAADAVALASLVNGAYRGDGSRAGWTTEADLLDGQRTDPAALVDEMTAEGQAIVLAERDGELVGSFLLAPAAAHGASGGYLGMLTVRPDLQGSGLGRELLAEAERRCVGRGWDRVMMTVIRQRAELIAYYARRGYLPTGETEPFPMGEERFGIPRRSDLEFVVLRKQLVA